MFLLSLCLNGLKCCGMGWIVLEWVEMDKIPFAVNGKLISLKRNIAMGQLNGLKCCSMGWIVLWYGVNSVKMGQMGWNGQNTSCSHKVDFQKIPFAVNGSICSKWFQKWAFAFQKWPFALNGSNTQNTQVKKKT